jgi:hypothetical protein
MLFCQKVSQSLASGCLADKWPSSVSFFYKYYAPLEQPTIKRFRRLKQIRAAETQNICRKD